MAKVDLKDQAVIPEAKDVVLAVKPELAAQATAGRTPASLASLISGSCPPPRVALRYSASALDQVGCIISAGVFQMSACRYAKLCPSVNKALFSWAVKASDPSLKSFIAS